MSPKKRPKGTKMSIRKRAKLTFRLDSPWKTSLSEKKPTLELARTTEDSLKQVYPEAPHIPIEQPQEILQPTRTDRADSGPIELPPVSLLSDSPTEEMQISPDLPAFHIPPETFSPCGVPTVANPFLALVPAALPAYSFVFGAQCCPASPSPFVQSALPPVPYAPPAAPPGGLQTGGFHIGVVKRRTR